MIAERTKRKKIQSKYSKGDDDDEYDLEKLMKIANGQQMDDEEERFTLYKIKKFRQQHASRFVLAEYAVDDIEAKEALLETGTSKGLRALQGKKISKKFSSKAPNQHMNAGKVGSRASKAKDGIAEILEDDEYK
jgi:hypothetical protein